MDYQCSVQILFFFSRLRYTNVRMKVHSARPEGSSAMLHLFLSKLQVSSFGSVSKLRAFTSKLRPLAT